LDGWNPGASGTTVYSLAAYSNTVFVTGLFSAAGGSNRLNIAAIDATTGWATGWDAHQVPPPGSSFNPIVTSGVYSNTLYIGGYPFGTIGGQSRRFAAALDVSTGAATSWDPKVNYFPSTYCGVGNSLYIGGLFGCVGAATRTNLAAFDLTTHQVTSWNPGVLSSSTLEINALTLAGDNVFLCGFFTNVGGVAHANLAAVDRTTGATIGWNPDPPSTCYALAASSDKLYVGGAFSSISGASLNGLAEFDLASLTLTGWNPGFPTTIIRDVVVDGNTLYVGGLFTTVNSISQRRIASFDLTSGALNAWNPGITTGSYVDAIAVSGSTVFLGGSFSVVGGFGRTNFVAVDAGTAQVLPPVAHADQPVYSLAVNSNVVFIAGNFSTINSQPRAFLAAIDTTLNQLAAWNPNPNAYVKTLRVSDGTLYAGGPFSRISRETATSFAAFPLALRDLPTIVSNSTKRLTDGSVQFRLTALGVAQATIVSSTNLQNWDVESVVPLVGGNGVFTDSAAIVRPRRFFRVRVP
jgi:hypothetical protein